MSCAEHAQDSSQPELGWCSVKSEVRLPVKAAELRRKLYLKARQEPKFTVARELRSHNAPPQAKSACLPSSGREVVLCSLPHPGLKRP